MIGSNSLVHMHGEVNGLSGSQLGDQDVWVRGRNGVLAAEVLDLLASRDEDDVARINVGVMVSFERVVLSGRSILIDGACHVKLEADRVPVEAAGIRVLASLWLLVPLEEVVQTLTATLEWDESKTMRENLVLNDRGVVLDINVLDSEGGNLGE